MFMFIEIVPLLSLLWSLWNQRTRTSRALFKFVSNFDFELLSHSIKVVRNGPIELLVDQSLSMKILISLILLIIKEIVQKMADGRGKDFTVKLSAWHFSVLVRPSDVGDLMMVTILRCWRQKTYVGDIPIGHHHNTPECDIGDWYLTLVPNIQILSPTHLVSNIRHKHRCNPSRS